MAALRELRSGCVEAAGVLRDEEFKVNEAENEVMGLIGKVREMVGDVKAKRRYDKVTIDRLEGEKGNLVKKIQSIWDKND